MIILNTAIRQRQVGTRPKSNIITTDKDRVYSHRGHVITFYAKVSFRKIQVVKFRIPQNTPQPFVYSEACQQLLN